MLEMPARLARGGPMAKANPTATRRVRYEEDLYAWSLEQAALLRARRADSLDWAHLAEEIEWMVGRDRRELKNRVRVILLRLLKWQGQPGRRGGNWRKSLRTQRRRHKRQQDTHCYQDRQAQAAHDQPGDDRQAGRGPDRDEVAEAQQPAPLAGPSGVSEDGR